MLEAVPLTESALRRSYAFDRFGAAAAVLDASGVVVETNEAWRLFATLNEARPDTTGPGVSYLDVCDRAFAAGVDAAGAVAAGLRSVLRGERGSFELEYPCPSAIEDRWFILHASTAPIHDGAGVVLFHVNITSRKLLEERFGARAERDPATGLPDRRAGMRLIEDGLARAKLLDARLTVFKVSVDGLGAVEDELGSPAAEELMVQVMARTLRALRAGDHVCPLGGGDLVVACADLDDEVAVGIVRRLEDATAAPFQLGASEIALGVNIGVATSSPGSTPIALLAAATAADSVEIRAARLVEQRARAVARPPSDIRMASALPPDRAAALALEVARAQRDAVLAHSSDLVLYVEEDGTIAWASPAIRIAMGIAPESLVGRSGFEMIHPDDRDQALTELGAVANLGDTARVEHRVITDDGRILWVEETVTNLLDDPHVGYIVANLRDITERKQYELAQARLSAIVAYSTSAIVSTTLDGMVQTWNDAAGELYGYAADEIVGHPITPTVPADCAAQLQTQLDRAVADGHPVAALETRGRRADGTEFDASITVSPIRDGDGKVIATSRVIRDVSEQVRLRRHLEIDRRRLADAQRSAHLGSFEIDDISHTMTWSVELNAILGLGLETAQDAEAFRARIHPDDLARVDAMLEAAGRTATEQECVHRIVRPDGEVRWVAARACAATDPKSPGVSGTLLDVTERKQLELDLRHQATHDALTGIANRAFLLEQLDTAMSEEDASVGLLLFDVDRFKLINDTLGHDLGDQLLVTIADAMGGTLGPRESAARFDSDSFAIVARGLASPAQAQEIADRTRRRFAQGLTIGTDRYRPTVSIGIVIIKPGDTAITALRDAETAMYRAKEQGRNRAEWFDPALHRKVIASFEIERDLRAGIENDQLYLVFQPVLDLQTNEISSCEALVRWRHPARGSLGAEEFIPVAESAGLIVAIGRWVLPRALAIAAGWPGETQIAVNLSAAELAEPDLVAFVRSTLAESDFPAARLVFEITETAVIHDPTAAARTIGALRTLGVAVVIDDFGTGYTSLAFLRDYRIDGLKIDRSFVTDLDHGSNAIVDAMIRMSSALGLEVIAEGIETPAQLEELRALGCRFIQGYLVSRPVAPDELSFAGLLDM